MKKIIVLMMILTLLFTTCSHSEGMITLKDMNSIQCIAKEKTQFDIVIKTNALQGLTNLNLTIDGWDLYDEEQKTIGSYFITPLENKANDEQSDYLWIDSIPENSQREYRCSIILPEKEQVKGILLVRICLSDEEYNEIDILELQCRIMEKKNSLFSEIEITPWLVTGLLFCINVVIWSMLVLKNKKQKRK